MERGIGLHADALDGGIEFFESASDADECAAGSDAGDEMGDPAFGLPPDFHRGGFVMGAPVGIVVVLIGIEIFIRIGLRRAC